MSPNAPPLVHLREVPTYQLTLLDAISRCEPFLFQLYPIYDALFQFTFTHACFIIVTPLQKNQLALSPRVVVFIHQMLSHPISAVSPQAFFDVQAGVY